jgi:hypothetical protein
MMDTPPPIIYAPAVPAPPPVVASGASIVPSPRSTAIIVAYGAQGASCGGVDVPFAINEPPLPTGATRYEPVSPANTQPPRPASDIVLSFHIDAQGRAVGIKREAATPSGPTLYVDSSDLEPALAVSRFASGRPRLDCRATYRATTVPLADADPQLLSAYMASGTAGSGARQELARLRPTGTNCGSPEALRPLLLAFPDPKKVGLRSGEVVYATIAFDVDASGKPINVRSLASNNAAHAAEGARAVGASRFAKGPAVGCITGGALRGQNPTEPPPRPDVASFRRSADTCSEVKPKMQFALKPAFPLPFRKRNVEGWAIVRYDVAPWGDTGNIEVVAAEPAAVFGEVAKQVVRSGKAEASATGATGCLAPVAFRLADDDGRPEAGVAFR